jgi:uncharacterized protein
MILKLLILAVIGIMVYRFFGGKVPILDRDHTASRKKKTPLKVSEETMVECSRCETWVVIEETTLVGGKYYCQ